MRNGPSLCRALLLFSGLSLTVVQALRAGDGTWTTSGPGPVRTIAVDPVADTLYAGEAYPSSGGVGGLFRSLDGGNTWGPRLISRDVTAVAAASSSAVYFGDGAGEVFKSTDGGTSWTQIVPADEEFHMFVYSILIDPLNRQVIYRTMESGVSIAAPNYPAGLLFRSFDGGVSWTQTFDCCLRPLVSADPHRSGTLYAARGAGIFKSSDFGTSWSALPAAGVNFNSTEVTTLAVDPFNSEIIYLGTTRDGVLKSSDGGKSFGPASVGLPKGGINALLPDPAHPGRLFAAVTDYSGLLLAGRGVLVSVDSGTSWNAMNAGLTNLNVSVLAIDGSGAFLHAGTDVGVFDIQLGASASEVLTGVFPVVAASPGAGQSFFKTSAQLRHSLDPVDGQPPPAPVVGRIVFHPQATSGTSTDPSLSFTLNAGSTLAIPDLLAAMGQSGLGSLDVLVSASTAPVGSLRIFNDTGAAGTFGFAEALFKPSDALNPGDRGVLIAPPDTALFRFNIGIRTLSGGASVVLTVRDSSGELRESLSRSFPANYMIQTAAASFLTDDTHRVPLALGPSDSITVQVVSGNAIVYGASADNRTNDPSFQVAMRLQ